MFGWLGGSSNTWPDGREKPPEGEWCLLEICQSRAKADQGNNDPGTIVTKKDSSGVLTMTFRGVTSHITHVSDVKSLALPELMDAVCHVNYKTFIVWMQPINENQYLIVVQKRDGCNGSSFGERFYMSLNGDFVPLTSGISLKSAKWNVCALARGVHIDPWWKTEMKKTMKRNPPASLPSFIADFNIQHSESAWLHKTGWISTSSSSCRISLTDCVLFIGASVSAADVDEIPLMNAEVTSSDTIQSTSAQCHYTLKITTKDNNCLIGFLTPSIRDKWAALLSLSTVQLGGTISDSDLLQHVSRLTQVYCPVITPPIDQTKDADQASTLLSGNFITKEGTNWVGDWKRRYVTVHESFITYSSEKGGKLSALPLGGSIVVPYDGEKKERNNFLFSISSPHLEAPFSFWCDADDIYRKWLTQISKVSSAATASSPLPVQIVDSKEEVNLNQVTLQVEGADVLVKLLQTGLPYSSVPDIPGIQSDRWRKLTSSSTLFGIEKEAVKKAKSGQLVWSSGADHGIKPLHEVQTSVEFVANLDGSSNIVRDTMLLEPEVILEGSFINKICNIRAVCVAMLPQRAEYTLRSVQTSSWFAVFEGSIIIRVFPPSAIHCASFTGSIPLAWDKSTSPLSYSGGRQVTLHAGEALYVLFLLFFTSFQLLIN